MFFITSALNENVYIIRHKRENNYKRNFGPGEQSVILLKTQNCQQPRELR